MAEKLCNQIKFCPFGEESLVYELFCMFVKFFSLVKYYFTNECVSSVLGFTSFKELPLFLKKCQ